ncbi:type 1 fimbrial protein [Klebsiella africana]|mgnify:CR=1 FL=1|uniref:type 1 fimbrial protein n=1 Tax=Klebsiella africana TaxID=2489010 RepID=UPI0019343131|nr:type 1 fimbrial protein [Klebsiella africana]QRF12306.1 type 1 fimbrial protein [Klebsiella africana]
MKKLILLFMMILVPSYSWAICGGVNYGDVSMTNLPEKILVNAGSYTAGTILYDSGKITRSQTEMTNCEGSIYAVFAWSSNNAGALVGDNIYATSVQGIGIRVKVWLNISGEYDGDTDDFSPDSQVHYIGDVNYYLGKPSGFIDYYASTHYTPAYQLQLVATGGVIASNSTLSFSDPVATVSAKDRQGTVSISRLHISGTTSIQLIPMGCITNSSGLNFAMGSVNASEFNTATKVGSAREYLTLSCEPGTNVSMRVVAAQASGDNPDNTVMALTAETNAATGVGVQLNLKGEALPLNTDISLYTSNRTTVTNSGADASYSYFTNPDSPGGAAAMQTLAFSTNYYKTGSTVTPGTANATGVITFTYN